MRPTSALSSAYLSLVLLFFCLGLMGAGVLSTPALAQTDDYFSEQRLKKWQEKEKDGVKRMALVRSTFIVDKRGEIQHAQDTVNHGITNGDQGIDTTEGQAVDELLG